MSDLLKELYQEIILDHGSTPRNFGKCEPFNKSADGHNPLCGDKVHLTLLVDDQDIIKDIKFTGVGCAISIASTSLMTQSLKGKSTAYANNLFNDFSNLITGKFDELNIIDEEDSLYSLKGVGAFPMRVKCATLSWHAFKSAIDDKK
ncbi:MAG: Fe-S cluster assembly sulfur transfer protein SufU [Candidatus Pelagibacterales bacterium]|jgi:nitrogen fixation NifU-like protein|nr:SUF system NifU family Fe-S cluster assembly protein [Pelagibacterales bacterium]MDA7763655.1 SUF system NifU family Fe-S cluster assembly protein [Pelagibacterales bacterium]|tara:strand:- start:268 stop:708 length:441 start_codon:yes stop_codon:yes gene_type:complete